MHRPASLAVMLALVAAAVAQADEIAPERRAQLRHLVLQDCGSCHGMTMKGGLGSGLRPGDLAALDQTSLAGIILDGVPGTPMPPWRELITVGEAEWIAEALKKGEIR